MQDRSEEQIIARLLELENGGLAERRTKLAGERYLALVHDPDNGRSYVLRHGVDDTEGAEVPEDTEFYEYQTTNEAEREFERLHGDAVAAGQVVEEDSTDDIGDFESDGAEVRDLYADTDDPLTRDAVISEEEEP